MSIDNRSTWCFCGIVTFVALSSLLRLSKLMYLIVKITPIMHSALSETGWKAVATLGVLNRYVLGYLNIIYNDAALTCDALTLKCFACCEKLCGVPTTTLKYRRNDCDVIS